MQVGPVRAELLRADGQKHRIQRDLTKLIVSFPNFANAPNNKELSRAHVGEAALPHSEEQRRNNNQDSNPRQHTG